MSELSGNIGKDSESTRRTLLSLATDGWRFSKVFTRVDNHICAAEQSRYVSHYQYFLKQLEAILSDVGYRLVNLEGHPFDPGMAATMENLADFTPEDTLVVDQMLEPVIMGEQGVVKIGAAILRKVEL